MKERETSSSAQKAELRELVFNTKVDTGTPRYRCWINKNKASSAYGGSDGWRETDGGRGGVGRLSSRNTRARTMPVGGATRRHKDTDMPTTFPTSITSIRPLSLPLSLSLSLSVSINVLPVFDFLSFILGHLASKMENSLVIREAYTYGNRFEEISCFEIYV